MPTDDNTNDREGQQQGDAGDGSKYKPADLESAQKIIAALEKRVSEREGTIASLNERITAIEQANQSKLVKDGKFEELAAQRAAEIEGLKPAAQRAAELDKIIRELNEARIKAVPETMRSIIPAEYPPEKLQAWLVANEPLLKLPPPPDFGAGAGAGGRGKGNGQPELTAQEKEYATLAGLTPERYLEMKKAKGQPIELKKPASQDSQ